MVLIGANAASGAIPIQHLLQETTMSDHGIARDQLRAFIERIEGDHHNVIGLSLPTLRVLAADLGVAWTDLWATTRPAGPTTAR